MNSIYADYVKLAPKVDKLERERMAEKSGLQQMEVFVRAHNFLNIYVNEKYRKQVTLIPDRYIYGLINA
jgi:hypothetical protein